MTPSTLLEEQALSPLWQRPLTRTAGLVRDHLARLVPHATLAAISQQLVSKGYAARQQHHSRYWFTPRWRAQTCGQQLTYFITTYFQGSYSACLAHCVQQGLVALATIQSPLLATVPGALG